MSKEKIKIQLIEQTKWIPVEENSPMPNERCGRVLVSTSNGEVTTALYSEYSKTWYIGDFCGVGGAEPIAWMSLPKPYIGVDMRDIKDKENKVNVG